MARPDDPTTDLRTARILIERACPDLRATELDRLGAGWDHDVWVCEGRVFRFPRNDAAAASIERELTLLPWLAARLPTAIPVPEWSGQHVTKDGRSMRYAAHRFVPGTPLCDMDRSDEEREAIAPRLANFARALHAIDPSALPLALPPDELGRLDVERRGRSTREQLFKWKREGLLPAETVVRLFHALDAWPGAPPAEEPRVPVHADLHARNLLVMPRWGAGAAQAAGGECRLSGVLDWVDLHLGHRAVDLATAFEVLPPRARGVFFGTYGAVDEATVRRARWRAVDHATRTLAGSIDRRDELFVRWTQRALVEMAET